MIQYNLALIGFGGVNRALASLVHLSNERFAREFGFRLNVVAIADLHLGSVISPNGLDVRLLTETHFGEGGLASLSGGSADSRTEEVIKTAPADIVVEATYTQPSNGEPAISHCRWALESGKHVITTNKGPVALAARELNELAAEYGVAFEYEGSVMSGTPVIRMAKRTLKGVGLHGFEGILNGTSNFVLSRMEAGSEFKGAVREAQARGYAEADPTADLAGYDVRLKVVILANELLGARLRPEDVPCEGIAKITPADIESAAASGKRWKLIGEARRNVNGGIDARVQPKTLPMAHALANVGDVTNALSFHTDLLGPVTITGPGAGRVETAYALISDIIAVHDSQRAATIGETA